MPSESNNKISPSGMAVNKKGEATKTRADMDKKLSVADISEIIEMALSDHASFDSIREVHGIRETEVKALMRKNLKSGSYKAWRKRVRTFSDRRENYK
jgi:uncharacterized protein (TIGR03643 family)